MQYLNISQHISTYLNNITIHNISSASRHFLKPRHKILIRIGVPCGVHELLSTAFRWFDWMSLVFPGFCRLHIPSKQKTDEPKTKNPMGALTTFDDLLSISATQNPTYWPHRLDFESVIWGSWTSLRQCSRARCQDETALSVLGESAARAVNIARSSPMSPRTCVSLRQPKR